MDNDEGAEAEEFLWSLGVGEALPEWLKELRQQERRLGLNQEPRQSAPTRLRPGIGPHRAWSAAESSEADPVRQPSPLPQPSAFPKPSPTAAPTQPSIDPKPLSTAAPKPAASRAPPVQAATASPGALEASRTAPTVFVSRQQERRTDPDDGQAYSLDELKDKYKGTFSEQEIEDYFRGDCELVQAQASPATSNPEELRPRPKEIPARASPKFGMSIKEWLACLDDSGFLSQYHDGIAAKFDSLEQIVDIYVKGDGVVDKQFFTDAGIAKLGHKRLFEKWFRENCTFA